MRVKRRATLTTLAVVALLAASVGTATAKKPVKPKPPSAVPIAVSMDAAPLWVHEDADRIRYTVTLENKTSETIAGVFVEFTAAEVWDAVVKEIVPFVETVDIGSIEADGTAAAEFERHVSQFSEEERCDIGAECSLSAYVVVSVVVDGDETVITQTEMSTPLLPDPSCGFEFDAVFDEERESWFVEGSSVDDAPVDSLCIWTLPVWDADWDEVDGWDLGSTMAGVWEITVMPMPPTNLKRSISASVRVRDGVPGNWCTQWLGTPSGFGDTWKWSEDLDNFIAGQVYLPGGEDVSGLGLDEGMCLNGGHGGDYFEVGNPKAFYLATDGYVTVRWISAVPADPPPEN